MIMIGAASPSALDRYSRGIEELTLLFPGAWGVVSMADETVRAERWDISREGVQSTLMWNDIIASSAYGEGGPHSHWWFMHVVGPLTTARGSAVAVVAAVEGVRPAAHAAFTSSPADNAMTKGGSRSSGGGGAKGTGKAGTCHRFQIGSCVRPDCQYKHACRGCGGPMGFNTCPSCKGGTPGGAKSKKSKRSSGRGKAAGAGGAAK